MGALQLLNKTMASSALAITKTCVIEQGQRRLWWTVHCEGGMMVNGLHKVARRQSN